MLTNILEESTELLFYGGGQSADGEIALIGNRMEILSARRGGFRKKQLIPGYDGGRSDDEQRLWQEVTGNGETVGSREHDLSAAGPKVSVTDG